MSRKKDLEHNLWFERKAGKSYVIIESLTQKQYDPVKYYLSSDDLYLLIDILEEKNG